MNEIHKLITIKERVLEDKDKRIKELEAENWRLREALRKYGAHIPLCPMWPRLITEEDSTKVMGENTVTFCTCGLDAALQESGE